MAQRRQSNRIKSSPSSSPGLVHPTACFNCRQARQRCDRREPCIRCTCHALQCNYPPRSNRGRKRGSTNKPDTVEKLLSRINDSSVRDDVIDAIVQNHNRKGTSIQKVFGVSPSDQYGTDAEQNGSPDPSNGNGSQDTSFSPLQILAAAVVAQKEDQQTSRAVQEQSFGSSTEIRNANLSKQRASNLAFVDERLAKYFAPRLVDRTDWEVLSAVSEGTTKSSSISSRDPVAAGLIDDGDVARYFNLYLTTRNPFLGLLDPELHTPAYIRPRSFTLFSVICALGSALSPEPHDRLCHSILFSMAEDNLKWSIANYVKSLEIVQAIVLQTYWDSAHETLADDPYWLRISHATQLARELGIQRASTIQQKVDALNLSDPELKGRLVRDLQRTWLYVFIADKSFGMTTGRTLGVSYKDIPANLDEWWQDPTASPLDRLIAACVEYRAVLQKAFEERRRVYHRRDAIIKWQKLAFDKCNDGRASQVYPDGHPSSICRPVAEFYYNHGLIIINACALRDLISIDGNEESEEVARMSQQTLDVAMTVIDSLLSDELMVKLMFGLHNTQLIMISHLGTEVIHVIRRQPLTEDANRAGQKIRLLANHIEAIANFLPPTSWVSMYSRIFHVFVAQLEEITGARNDDVPADMNGNFSDWWRFIDIESFDFANDVDLSFMRAGPQSVDTNWSIGV